MVDKLYIMLPEFKIKDNIDIKAAWDAFYSDPDNSDIVDEIDTNIGIALDDYIDKHPEDSDLTIDEYEEWILEQGYKKYQFSDKAKSRFNKWLKKNKKAFIKDTTIEKVKYDYDKSPQEQSVQARNNALIDIMWGVLTSPGSAPQVLTPGNFDLQKAAARVVDLLNMTTEVDLKNEGYTFSSLLNLPLDKLDKLVEKYKKSVDPLSPRTQVIFHQQNMTGATMIGIYANHNANHAMMQHTYIEINGNGNFNFAGRELTSLHEIKDGNGRFISSNTANYLAASVDNVKDNTLYSTNQNTFTGDPSMLLSRLGYSPIEIAILMRQPIVMEMTKRFFRESRKGKTKEQIIQEVIDKTQDAGNNKGTIWKDVKNNKFKLEVLMKDLTEHKFVAYKNEGERQDFYRRQGAVGLLFQRIMKTATALSDVVAATRADTSNGAAGPTIADTMIKLQKVDDLYDSMLRMSFPLNNVSIIREIDYNKDNIDEFREKLLKSDYPLIQAFYTLGLRQTEKLMGRYFPQFTNSFKNVIDTLRKMSASERLNAKTINSIFNDLFAFIMSDLEFFGASTTSEGKPLSAHQKRYNFINKFPQEFDRIVAKNPDIANLEFIKRLKTIKSSKKTPVPLLVFENVGSLTPTLRDRYTRDWASLLYMNNKEANDLALNLFLYNYYRNGFAFGPSTFNHLAPTIVRNTIPDYVSKLNSLINNEDYYDRFINQYIYNHLDNRTLVPEIPIDSDAKFSDDKTIFDTVEINVSRYTNKGDRKAVRKISKIDDEDIFEFFEYIARKVGNDYVYYRLSSSDEINGTAQYERIEPLGLKNNFIEYNYNRDVEQMQSAIKKNREAPEIDSKHFSSTDIDDEDSSFSYSEEYIRSAFEDALKASEIIYGERLEKSSMSEDITTLEPNEDYTDADDKPVCNIGTLRARF